MEKDIIQLQVSLDGFNPHKDGSVGLRFITQELTGAEKLKILNCLGEFGWLLFKADEKSFDMVDVPKENSGMEEGKKPSERLRAVLYIKWSQGNKEDEFPIYYRRSMEKIINQLKETLEPLS